MPNLTSNDFKKSIGENPVVILPLGAYEQHGPAGYLGADSVISDYLAAKIADVTGTVCLPAIPFGFSKIHDSFSGTITIDQEIYCELLKCILKKLKIHGVKGVVLFNGHGGNLIPLRRLIEEEGDFVYFLEWFSLAENAFFANDHKSHAGSEELSVLGAINPDYVTDSMVVDMIPAPKDPQILNAWEKFEYITSNGVHLLANKYNKDVGSQVITYVVEKGRQAVTEYLERIKKR